MYASDTLTDAGQKWAAAADALLSEAERIGPLEEGVFGELGTDDEGVAATSRIDTQVDALLSEGERAFAELRRQTSESVDARFQAASLLVSTLAVGDVLSVAGQSPEDVFGELSVESVQATTFTDARATVAEARAIVTVPKTVSESLEKIEVAGATESWKVLAGSVGTLAGGALVSGLDGLLRGAAAAAFDAIKDLLSHWRDALKRGAIRIAKWVVEKVQELLPKAVVDKLKALVTAIQEKIDARAGDLATDAYGRILGRAETEKAWNDAAAAGKDLSSAESKLGGVTTSHTGRIAWVTKGRKIIEKYDKIVSGIVAELPAGAQVAFAALVAAVLGFVAFEVWDGFNDVEALV